MWDESLSIWKFRRCLRFGPERTVGCSVSYKVQIVSLIVSIALHGGGRGEQARQNASQDDVRISVIAFGMTGDPCLHLPQKPGHDDSLYSQRSLRAVVTSRGIQVSHLYLAGQRNRIAV
ncbi:hypothetical protein K466DRAFT_151597 [Polyporus arcularius HHB13444]|uniref:Uncharacterized protein n=1 Tax=Polyporus arcularius HHB13444 TaxID=1314778 RepID=A0A5C3PB33_9APHY|nr:hypothetical protein K466DRAFT_151597 [Polyporus arcularius HHB13444]